MDEEEQPEGPRGKAGFLVSNCVRSHTQLCDPEDCSLPGFSSVGFFRQEYWSGLPFPSGLAHILCRYLQLLFPPTREQSFYVLLGS